jgi:MtfA peptidase
MSDFEIIVVSLFLVMAVGVFVYFVVWAVSASAFGLIENIYIMIFDRPFMPHCELYYRELEPEQELILKKYSKYFRLLPEKKQNVFATRMVKFLKHKEFIAKGNLVLTEEMKVLVAESAVKLTFGLRNYMFEKFEQVFMFKGSFYSDATRSYNIGETNPRGVIVFSWKDLLEGDLNDADNLNVGVHEFAHAYMIDNKANEEQYFELQCELFDKYYEDKQMLEVLKSHHYFRNYAFRNKMEFFAVAAEHFFETPVQFKKEIPELYQVISKMLNQDPSLMYAADSTPEIKPVIISSGGQEREDSKAPDQPHGN